MDKEKRKEIDFFLCFSLVLSYLCIKVVETTVFPAAVAAQQ
jgi:hypothetical protein